MRIANKDQSTKVRLALRRDPVAGNTEAQQLPQQEHHEEVSRAIRVKTVLLGADSSRSKPQTLFQKTSTRSFEAAKGQPMFADIPKKGE